MSRAAFATGTPNRAGPDFSAWSVMAACFFAAVGAVLIAQQPIIHPPRTLVACGGYAVLISVFGLPGPAPYITRIFDYARATPCYALSWRDDAPLCIALATGLILDLPTGIVAFLAS
jgi:hypothetical protein